MTELDEEQVIIPVKILFWIRFFLPIDSRLQLDDNLLKKKGAFRFLTSTTLLMVTVVLLNEVLTNILGAGMFSVLGFLLALPFLPLMLLCAISYGLIGQKFLEKK